MIQKIGLGGGCHWCTEGVFQSLIGIDKIEQGWISSLNENSEFSEGILVHFDSKIISLSDLIEIHLHTHASTSNHSMRKKYRSAVYVFSEIQKKSSIKIIQDLQDGFDKAVITEVLYFDSFKANIKEQLDYFYSRPESPFCQTYIHPKIQVLMKKYSNKLNWNKVELLQIKSLEI